MIFYTLVVVSDLGVGLSGSTSSYETLELINEMAGLTEYGSNSME